MDDPRTDDYALPVEDADEAHAAGDNEGGEG